PDHQWPPRRLRRPGPADDPAVGGRGQVRRAPGPRPAGGRRLRQARGPRPPPRPRGRAGPAGLDGAVADPDGLALHRPHPRRHGRRPGGRPAARAHPRGQPAPARLHRGAGPAHLRGPPRQPRPGQPRPQREPRPGAVPHRDQDGRCRTGETRFIGAGDFRHHGRVSTSAPTAQQGRLLRRGLRLIRRQVALHPRPFAVAVAGAAIYAIGTVAQSWVLGQVVDRAVTPRFESGQPQAGGGVAAAAPTVAVGLVKTVGIITRRIAATMVHANVQATLREGLAQRYHRLPLTWHHEHPAGELLSRAEGDLEAASEILSPLPFATGVLTMLGATVVWLFLADLFLATLGLLVVPAILVLNLAFQRRVEHPTTLGQERLGDMSAVAHESFDGALVVKALQAEEAEGRRFTDKAELLRDARIEAARVTANFEASLDALPALATVGLLVIGVWRIEQGAITPGTLV